MNTCYIISYDMANGGNYDKLYDTIESYGTWARITESTWAIETKDSATKIRDKLEPISTRRQPSFCHKIRN